MSIARDGLAQRYVSVRAHTERLAAPLSPEDQQLQSMPSCSPTKWHRAHTTWFFETFVLAPRGVSVVDSTYAHLFNSYYEAAGSRHPRPKRGLLSRPSANDVTAYRRAVDGRVLELLEQPDDASSGELAALVTLGLAHEEQHQELLVTDILHAFSENPLRPIYGALPDLTSTRSRVANLPDRRTFEGGLVEIGVRADEGFAFDNEGPRHKVFLERFTLDAKLVTIAEVQAFIRDGGFQTPSLWLSEGFDFVRREGIETPPYTRVDGDRLVTFGLEGERVVADDEPALFLSYFEADAIARYLGGRLPTEAEWEHAVRSWGPERPTDLFDPRTGTTGPAWEWTSSAYAPYPRFRPFAGPLGEYNGKFMSSQLVLRGGSAFTPVGHVRASYRNFWPPDTRFQRTAVRIARDA